MKAAVALQDDLSMMLGFPGFWMIFEANTSRERPAFWVLFLKINFIQGGTKCQSLHGQLAPATIKANRSYSQSGGQVPSE